MEKDPTEHVSCGQCGKVNNVPYGLERFKCYNCATMVSISREPTAACAAASTTAQYYEGLQEAPPPADTKKSDSSSGFFKSFQKTMNKTFQKVEKAFEQPAPVKPAASTTARAEGGPPALSTEEEQLQWALNASLADSQHAVLTETIAEAERDVVVGEDPALARATSAPTRGTLAAVVAPTRPSSTTPNELSPGDQLQAAAAQAAQRLQTAEERAQRAEAELAAVKQREAAAVVERDALRRQLGENERLVKGLTEQLDAVNRQRDQTAKNCKALELSLQAARAAEAQALLAQAADELDSQEHEEEKEDQQGMIMQLVARIAELEGQLMMGTHFAVPAGSEAKPAPSPADEQLKAVLEASLKEMESGGAAPAEEPQGSPAAAFDIGRAVADAGKAAAAVEEVGAAPTVKEAHPEVAQVRLDEKDVEESGIFAAAVDAPKAVQEEEEEAAEERQSAEDARKETEEERRQAEDVRHEEQVEESGISDAADATKFQPPSRAKGEEGTPDAPAVDSAAASRAEEVTAAQPVP